LRCIGNLALTYKHQGRWEEVQNLLKEVMDIGKETVGQDHTFVLACTGNLASVFSNAGTVGGGRAARRGKLEKARNKMLGREHPHTLLSISNLAHIFRKQQKWKEAEDLASQAIEIRTKVLGREHPDTLVSMVNLVSTYL
jgi:hypothetical protein